MSDTQLSKHDGSSATDLPERIRPVNRLQAAEAPSARFGWHTDPSSKTKQVLGWLSVLSLLLFLIGNQQGHIEDFYLVLFAAGLAVLLIRDLYLKKRSPIPKV